MSGSKAVANFVHDNDDFNGSFNAALKPVTLSRDTQFSTGVILLEYKLKLLILFIPPQNILNLR